MELAVLIIVIAAIAWWVGLVRSARRLAGMAESEVVVLEKLHKASQVRRLSEVKVSDNQFKQAASNVAALNNFDLFDLGSAPKSD